MPMGQLTQVLREITDPADERLLVGPQTVDDAGVVLLGKVDGLPSDARIALVQTVDYFPPIVDDPHYYGAIAAANALSDVYAMGGKPHSVLNIAGFPADFPEDWIREIFRGGFAKVRESGAILAGGHTVRSQEPLFGFAVTGTIDPTRVTANSSARAGDRLYLTKSLGMGVLTTAAKLEKIGWKELEPAAEQMATLNAAAASAMLAAGARACTDITGFGLVGHASNIARASGVTLRFHLERLPFFAGAVDLARERAFPGAMQRGKTALGDQVRTAASADKTLADLVFDAETSGGLLIAIAAERAQALERELAARSVPVHAVGEVTGSSGVLVELA